MTTEADAPVWLFEVHYAGGTTETVRMAAHSVPEARKLIEAHPEVTATFFLMRVGKEPK